MRILVERPGLAVQMITVVLGEGQRAPLPWLTAVEPRKVVVVPEMQVLRLKRGPAEAALDGASEAPG